MEQAWVETPCVFFLSPTDPREDPEGVFSGSCFLGVVVVLTFRGYAAMTVAGVQWPPQAPAAVPDANAVVRRAAKRLRWS